jgi:hypothetical protein
MGPPEVSLTKWTTFQGVPALLLASRSRLRIDKSYG